MHAELTLSLATLYGFLLVLTRVAAALTFVPLPGVRQGPAVSRVVLSLAVTVILFPQWPSLPEHFSMGRLLGWLLLDAGLGILIGIGVAFVTEAFQIAAQAVGLQAGFAYASMVDPQTQADSGVLLIFAQLAAGLIFFALGLDREVVRIFARSLDTFPPGTAVASGPAVEVILRLGTGMFSTGLRLALPALALLTLMDLALALLGRLNAQLQLLTLSFPVKLLASVAILAWIVPMFPRMLGAYGGQVFRGLRAVIENP